MDNLGTPISNEFHLLGQTTVDTSILDAKHNELLLNTPLPLLNTVPIPTVLDLTDPLQHGIVGGLLSQTVPAPTPFVTVAKTAEELGIATPVKPNDPVLSLFERLIRESNLVPSDEIDSTAQLPVDAASTSLSSDGLTPAIIEELKVAAISRWAQLGLSSAKVEKLRGVTLTVGELASNTLAQTQGYTITLDNDAAGVGWYVDSTPLDNSEFPIAVGVSQFRSIAGDAPFGKVDLFSAIEHEFGHILGLEHSETDVLMRSTLPIGERLLPSLETLTGVRLDGVVNDRAGLQAPDLSPSRVIATDSFGNSLSNVDFGGQFNVTWDVSQIGTANLTNGNWQDRVYLSRDNVLSADDVQIINQAQNRTLAINEQYTSTALSQLNYNPIGSLPVDANGFVSESEPNNSISQALNLQQNFLQIDANNYLVKAKGSISSGGEGDFYRIYARPGDRLILNQTGFDTYLYLYNSSGQVITQNDDSFGTLNSYIDYQLPSNAYAGDYYVRAAGYSGRTGNYNLTIQLQSSGQVVTRSIDPGDYYLLIKTDVNNSLAESNETNNVIASTTPIRLNTFTRSDLSIVGSASSTTPYIGSVMPVSWNVTNAANADAVASGWFDYVYLSNDLTLDNTDIALASYARSTSLPLLSAGASYGLQANVTLPVGVSGRQYLIFVTDRTNARLERDESELPHTHPKRVECGLLPSRATAATAVDLRPYCFGLTLPPGAVTLVPNVNIRKPSFLMFIAALMSRSCRLPQWAQSNSRTDRSIFGNDNKVFAHKCDDGKNRPTSRYTFPSCSALYLSIVQNIPQPASLILLARL